MIPIPVGIDRSAPIETTVWQPFDGFQERAVSANANEVFIGGAKGPGKTQVLLTKPLRWAHKSLYAAAFVRETFKELQRVIDEAHRMYGRLPTHQRPSWTGTPPRFTWPSGAFVQFGHSRTVNELTWTQGGNWAEILYDELGNQPDERVIDTLLSELRCPDPTIRRQFIGSGNPGFAGHPVMKRRYVNPCGKQGQRIAWSRVVLPNGERSWWSRQFVPGRVTDNPIYANDAEYMGQLMRLPDRMKRCLMDGDWDAATGVALDELEPSIHLVPGFQCPDHWPYIAAFDWGYQHNAVFLWGRVDDDGRVWVCDTIKRRLLRDWDLASTYNSLVPEGALRLVQAGHDCWQEVKARGQNAPETQQYFAECGIHLVKANVARIEGYKTLLQHLAWRETEFLPQRQPMLQFFDTPGNRWLVEEHLSAMVMNPDDPRDVLKVNADPETGDGGDDGYDGLRYLVAKRRVAAETQSHRVQVSAWDPDVLRRQAEKFWRPVSTPLADRNKNVFLGG